MSKIALILAVLSIPLSIAIFSGGSKEAEAVTDAEAPIVLELFTSQSCSSCPPADRLLGELAQENDNIIALSCNVTYWNHLHWKDTLSKKFCTERQRSYVDDLNSRGPYTPQVVVNGRHEMVGSQRSKVTTAINKEVRANNVQPIQLNLSKNILEISLPNLNESEQGGDYTLLLLAHGVPHTQSIPSGENSGRTVNYTNPVENIVSLGDWNGEARELQPDISVLPEASGYVVLAQKNGVTGNIVAAGQVKAR